MRCFLSTTYTLDSLSMLLLLLLQVVYVLVCVLVGGALAALVPVP